MSKARPVTSYEEYRRLTEVELKDKFIFIDFYMQQCPWCYRVIDDFNRLIDDMNEWYGPEKVAILKIDGPNVRDLVFKFRVGSYPAFASVLPNTNGNPHD